MEKLEKTAAAPYGKIRYLPVLLLVLAVPLGVAAQNVMAGLATLLMMAMLWRRRNWTWRQDLAAFKVPLAAAGLYILWLIVASVINPQHPEIHVSRFFFGYLGWAILPWLIWSVFRGPQPFVVLFKPFSWICLLWALVALSQFIWGWRLSMSTIVSDMPRPRGFYSHPLTLAYTALTLWPLALWAAIHKPRQYCSWLFLGSIGTILFLTESRTAQAAALFAALSSMLFFLRGGKRWGLLAAVALGAIAIFATPNQISNKFKQTFATQGFDRFSDYPDDRLAFWHAHWLMIQERPFTGHGIATDTAYRTPYYEAIGLGDFIKKYEAHNLFLQILTNGGLIGLGLFLTWLVAYIVMIKQAPLSPSLKKLFYLTLATFLLAGLSQNSFQDAEVRFALTLFIAFVSCCVKDHSGSEIFLGLRRQGASDET